MADECYLVADFHRQSNLLALVLQREEFGANFGPCLQSPPNDPQCFTATIDLSTITASLRERIQNDPPFTIRSDVSGGLIWFTPASRMDEGTADPRRVNIMPPLNF